MVLIGILISVVNDLAIQQALVAIITMLIISALETLKNNREDKKIESLISSIKLDHEEGIYQNHHIVGEHYIQGYYRDQNRNNISGNARVNAIDISKGIVNASGAGSFNLGEISGTVTNTINQLPNFEHESEKQELKELLRQLHSAVLEAELDDEDQEESLKLVQAIAEALQDSQNRKGKRKAKRAMVIIQYIAAGLPPSAAMVTICNQLPDLINKIF